MKQVLCVTCLLLATSVAAAAYHGQGTPVPPSALPAITTQPGTPASLGLMGQSDEIFVGKVLTLNDTVLDAEVMAKDPPGVSMVVQIQAVFKAPKAVAFSVGQKIAVVAKEGGPFAEGQSAVFYAKTGIVGRGVQVAELDHQCWKDAAGEDEIKIALANLAIAQEQWVEAQEQAKFSAAAAVFVGKVSELHELAGQPVGISEHSPNWKEAVVEVTSALKGVKKGDKVYVRFSGSNDIMWHLAPKLSAGDVKQFYLQEDKSTRIAAPKVDDKVQKAYLATKADEVVEPDPAALADDPKVTVAGKVIEVRNLAGATKVTTGPDPAWREAVIDVSKGVVGAKTGDKLLVRFASSTEGKWSKWPKLEKNDDGVFFLRLDAVTGAPVGKIGDQAATAAYILVKSGDLQRATHVRMEAPPPGARP